MAQNEKLYKLAVTAALGTFLSDWDKTQDPIDIIDSIEKESWDEYDVCVWEPFENETGPKLVNLIGATVDETMETFALVAQALKDDMIALALTMDLDDDLNRIAPKAWVAGEGLYGD